MARWYSKEGKTMEGATLREARKLDLYPSVTTVLDIFRKYGIEKWKTEQAILSALTFPNSQDYTDTEIIKQIITDSEDESKRAANYGTIIHNLIARMLLKDQINLNEYEEKIQITMEAIKECLSNMDVIFAIERTFVSEELGYGGTIDCIGRMDDKILVIDFKTQKTEINRKYKKYPEWLYQLAAYVGLIDIEQIKNNTTVEYVNIVISSTEPGRIDFHRWSDEEINYGWEVFKTSLYLFKLIKNL
jgi:hypothetical protein